MRELFARTALRHGGGLRTLFGGSLLRLLVVRVGDPVRGDASGEYGGADLADLGSCAECDDRSSRCRGRVVEDDPAGRPPFFRADADYSGAFELVTFAEPHRIGFLRQDTSFEAF